MKETDISRMLTISMKERKKERKKEREKKSESMRTGRSGRDICNSKR